MNCLLVENLSKSYGDKVLFHKITFGLELGSKAALIARNGTGKTSLLNIIANLDIADEGQVVTSKDLKLAYLSQCPTFPPDKSVIEVILHAENETNKVIRAYEEAIYAQALNPTTENTAKVEELFTKMEALQAWDYELRVKQMLSVLKLPDIKQTIGTLSGGELKRVALAQVLLEEPDILLMDEPTNHLDLEMVEWLEGYLSRQKLTLLMVTHDRYFLDRVCNEIFELDNGNIYHYKGNYGYFLEKKAEREAIETKEIETAKNLLRTELEWMRRMPQARTTKSKARIDSFYELQEKASKRKPRQNEEIKIKSSRLGNKIVELHNITKYYQDYCCFKDFSYLFKKHERIGILGPNGSGKSTLLEVITGKTKPDAGRIEIGDTVSFAYYRQEGLPVLQDKTVIEIVKDIAEYIVLGDGSELSASQFLSYFNFPYNVQHNLFSKLSGGEKRRLYLLTILMKNPNFIILDEPTNDLDIFTLSILEQFLEKFNGCVVVVSHDRFFLDKVAEHLFVFENDGKIRVFPGNYSDWFEYKQRHAQLIKAKKKEEVQNVFNNEIKEKKPKLTYKEQQALKQLEEEIASLEKEKLALEQKLTSDNNKPEELIQYSTRLGEILQLLDAKSTEWLELSMKAE